MVRTAFTLCLIAALLACLSRCSASAEAITNGVGSTAVCDCSSDDHASGAATTDSGEESPFVPDGKGSCPSCLCHGAISSDQVPDLDVPGIVTYELPQADSNFSEAIACHFAASAFEHVGQFARVETGRKICAHICTFLN